MSGFGVYKTGPREQCAHPKHEAKKKNTEGGAVLRQSGACLSSYVELCYHSGMTTKRRLTCDFGLYYVSVGLI